MPQPQHAAYMLWNRDAALVLEPRRGVRLRLALDPAGSPLASVPVQLVSLAKRCPVKVFGGVSGELTVVIPPCVAGVTHLTQVRAEKASVIGASDGSVPEQAGREPNEWLPPA